MKCKDCDSCKCGYFEHICIGVKNPFKIKDINADCTEYSEEYWKNYKPSKNKQTKDSIEYFKNWIKDDLKELDGDTESDYAQFILDKHRHINVAINLMEEKLNN
jgi:hypothetical protein